MKWELNIFEGLWLLLISTIAPLFISIGGIIALIYFIVLFIKKAIKQTNKKEKAKYILLSILFFIMIIFIINGLYRLSPQIIQIFKSFYFSLIK